MTAAERGHAGIVAALLDAGAVAARIDKGGNTAIALAAYDDVRLAFEKQR